MVAEQSHSIYLCLAAEVPDGGGREWRDPEDDMRSVVIFRRGTALYGYINSCPHQGRPLGLGRPGSAVPRRFLFDGEQRLVCPHHGAVFTVEDGACVSGPCRGGVLTPINWEERDGKLFWLRDSGASSS